MFEKNLFTTRKDLRVTNDAEYYDDLYNEVCAKTKESQVPIASYPTFNIDFKNIILDYISERYFPKDFKKIIKQFIKTTDNDNLVLCASNIKSVKLVRKEFSKLAIFLNRTFRDGLYENTDNRITYYSKDALAHEFLHMSSSIKVDNSHYYTGFKQIFLYNGLNEGYTELLSRRKFFNEDFEACAYRINVFILRILELLFYDKSLLESAYFHSDINFVYNTFCTYGSKEEFFLILKYLDLFSFSLIKPDAEILYLMADIVARTYDNEKIRRADNIIDEYFKPAKIKKFSLLG